MKIGVIGCGAYSLAISLMLVKNNSDITVWSESEDNVRTIMHKHELPHALKGVTLPENIEYTTDIDKASKDKDVIFIMVAAQYIESVMNSIKDNIDDNTVICLASKGIEQEKNRLLHEVIMDVKKVKHLAVISGGTFAIDIANEDSVGLSLASSSKHAINTIKNVLETDNLKLRETHDVIGTEVCGSIKNVLAIAAGIIDGLGYSNSTLSFFLTEAIHDVKDLIKRLGGDSKTITSFAGIGDIILTCTSTKSRNYTFGTLLGKKAKEQEIESYLLDNTVEGYATLKSVYRLLTKKHIDLEMIDVLYDIVFNKEDPQILIDLIRNKE